MPSSNSCFFNCIKMSSEAGKVFWCSHLLKNFPQFVVIHAVKGFGVVNKAEVDAFLELSFSFLMMQQMFAIWPLVPLTFLKPVWKSRNSWFMYYWRLAWRILSITLQESLKYLQVWLSLLWRSLLFSLIPAVPKILFVPSKSLWWSWGLILNVIASYLFIFVALVAQMVKSACNAVDADSIPGSGSSPGEGNGNSLQHSCLQNPLDRGTWQLLSMVLQSQTQLSD